jgi:hypothetical protein
MTAANSATAKESPNGRAASGAQRTELRNAFAFGEARKLRRQQIRVGGARFADVSYGIPHMVVYSG